MIWYYLILFFTSVLNIGFSWWPKVEALPFGIDLFVSTMFGYVQAFVTVFWPLRPFYVVFLFMIPFQLGLLTLKVFLGSRVPHADL